jgi:hypothetical protein
VRLCVRPRTEAPTFMGFDPRSAGRGGSESELKEKRHCASRGAPGYRVQSFLTGLAPVPLSQGSMYVVKQSNPTYQALVYPMPTSHPCVNRLVLGADNTAGSWPAPTYALGRYQLDNNGLPMRDKPLVTYLIVNICLDLGKSAVVDKQSVLRPNAMIVLALHWPCEGSGCANNGIGHRH